MTTLTESPVAPLLDRLFAEAEALSPFSIPEVAALSREERDRLLCAALTDIDAALGRLHLKPLK